MNKEELKDAISEASSAAAMWKEAGIALYRAELAEVDAKTRFLNALFRIEKLQSEK
jgi:hypothetical protein